MSCWCNSQVSQLPHGIRVGQLDAAGNLPGLGQQLLQPGLELLRGRICVPSHMHALPVAAPVSGDMALAGAAGSSIDCVSSMSRCCASASCLSMSCIHGAQERLATSSVAWDAAACGVEKTGAAEFRSVAPKERVSAKLAISPGCSSSRVSSRCCSVRYGMAGATAWAALSWACAGSGANDCVRLDGSVLSMLVAALRGRSDGAALSRTREARSAMCMLSWRSGNA